MSTNGSAFTTGNANAPNGAQVAFIKNNGSISQSVYFDAGTYNISFLATQRANYQTQNQQIEVLVDGTQVAFDHASFHHPAPRYTSLTRRRISRSRPARIPSNSSA